MKSEQIKEITERATEQLVAALNAGHSEALTAYLKAIGRFHRYSLHNVMLIASQKPNASYVAGFRTWKRTRPVREKGRKRHPDSCSHPSQSREGKRRSRNFDFDCWLPGRVRI
jgi:N-terminal domain of anti-restriction factor ArdC